MAYIRGSTISYCSWKTKQYQAHITFVETDSKSLEKKHF